MTITLAELLKDSAYKLTQFKAEQIKTLEARITLKDKRLPVSRSGSDRVATIFRKV